MKPLQTYNFEDLDKFADVLENTVVLLQIQGNLSELHPRAYDVARDECRGNAILILSLVRTLQA